MSKTVSIKKFYIRRMLRIWPLYFGFGIVLIFGIDYFLAKLGMPVNTPELKNLFFLATFSINLQMLFSLPNKGIIELFWSVCIEEQFYLFAPWLVKKAKNNMLSIIIGLIVLGIGSKFILYYLESHNYYHFQGNNPLYYFTVCRFDSFGIGALAAYLYFNKSAYQKVQGIFENKPLQFIITTITLLYMTRFFPDVYIIEKYFFSTLPSFLYAYIILAASTGNFFVNLETKFLNQMGKYSYGIYVFHAVVAQLTLFAFIKLNPPKSILIYDFVFPLVSMALTCIVAGLSYELYEKRFMNIKTKFTVIKSQEK